MTTWSKDELRKIAEANDLHIAPFREDGATYGTPTWIWSVAVGLHGFGFRASHADHAARFVLRLGSRRPSTASVWTATRSSLPSGAPEIR